MIVVVPRFLLMPIGHCRPATPSQASPLDGILSGHRMPLFCDDKHSQLGPRPRRAAGADRWRFEMARVQLAYGERLRRARSIVEARNHLSAAFDVFHAMQAAPWVARAGTELRATGRLRSGSAAAGAGSLTAQEREIAILAAKGMTNKEIAARLFLSDPTASPIIRGYFNERQST
jgi:hypothetical protein